MHVLLQASGHRSLASQDRQVTPKDMLFLSSRTPRRPLMIVLLAAAGLVLLLVDRCLLALLLEALAVLTALPTLLALCLLITVPSHRRLRFGPSGRSAPLLLDPPIRTNSITTALVYQFNRCRALTAPVSQAGHLHQRLQYLPQRRLLVSGRIVPLLL